MPNNFRPIVVKFFCLIIMLVATSSYAQSMGGNRSKGDDAINAQNTALKLVEALHKNDFKFLGDVLDVEHIATVAANNVADDKKKIAEIVEGFTNPETKKTITQNAFNAILTQTFSAKFLRMLNEKGTLRPLIRIDYEDAGHEYIILYVSKVSKITDIFFASRGKTMSESYTQALQMLISPGKSFINKLLSRKVVDQDLVQKFNKIGEYRRSGEIQKAYDIIQSFPKEAQQQRIIIDIAIEFAQSISDEEYMRQLTLLEKYYGDDESTQFMLVDYYFMQEDYKNALKALVKVTERFGDDGALNVLKATMSFSDGDLESAEQFALNGIELEADFVDSYWALADIYNHKKEFDQLVKVFDDLTVNFGVEFTPESIGSVPSFNEFSQSNAFKEWMELN